MFVWILLVHHQLGVQSSEVFVTFKQESSKIIYSFLDTSVVLLVCVWAVGKLQHAILIWCNCFSNAALINSGLRKRAGSIFPIRAPTHKSLFACKCPRVCAHEDYTSVFSFVLVVVEMSYCTCQSVSTVAKSLTDFQHFSNTHLKMNPDSSGWTSLMSLRVGSPCTIYSLDFLHLSLLSFCVHLTE